MQRKRRGDIFSTSRKPQPPFPENAAHEYSHSELSCPAAESTQVCSKVNKPQCLGLFITALGILYFWKSDLETPPTPLTFPLK